MDELGVPFSVTVDFQSTEDQTVTLRERDTMTQIRMPLGEVAPLIARLVKEEGTWKVRHHRTIAPLRCVLCFVEFQWFWCPHFGGSSAYIFGVVVLKFL